MKMTNNELHNQHHRWQYEITWYTKKRKPVLIDQAEKAIAQVLMDLCKELKINLGELKIQPDQVSFCLLADKPVNMHKTLKNTQKKISKSLAKKHNLGAGLWDEKALVITGKQGHSDGDIRIEKALEDLWAVEYYDIDEGLSDEMDEFKDYLENRNLDIIDYGDQVFLIDQEALLKEVNLNCFACTKIHQYGCCSGSPCHMSTKNKKMLHKHLDKIEQEIKELDEVRYKEIVAEKRFVTEDGVIKEHDGRCTFLVRHEGVSKCVAHKYALEHQIPIYEICPLSCLMYPLEIIELITTKQKSILLLTSALEDSFTEKFSRWGSYKSLDVGLRCVNKAASNEIFKASEYKPVYEVNKGLLSHEFGTEVYEGIRRLINQNRG